jgi:hypothetical protein
MSLSSKNRLPSPALIVAAIALVVAMAGTAIAQDPMAKLTKSKVKSIAKKQADKRLKANVAGSHVNTADTAGTADSAASAGNAAEVNGNKIVQIDFRPTSATGNETILNLDGLQMKSACNGTNDTITAETTVANSEIYFHTVRSGLTTTTGDDNDFNPGETLNLHPGQTSRELVGQVRYVSGTGDSVVVQWGSGSDIPGATCLTFGFAIGS